jgi:hypothetical protein
MLMTALRRKRDVWHILGKARFSRAGWSRQVYLLVDLGGFVAVCDFFLSG